MEPKKRSNIPRLLFWMSLIVVIALGIFKQQDIFDWYTLRGYTPPAALQNIATETTMNAEGRKLFFVNKPALQEKAAFYKSCEEGETTIVLGCYKPNDGIFVLNVTDARLEGIMQVTSAHEMLHVAYERLSSREKKTINAELDRVYNTLNNPQLTEKIGVYKNSGADIHNELHSILGTEVVNLSPVLEAHYKKYFINRAQVTALSAKYQAVFQERRDTLTRYDADLVRLEGLVKTNNAILDTDQASITAENGRLDALLKADRIEEYNAAVPAYNARVSEFKSLLYQTKQYVIDYKTTLDARNQVALEAQELNKALDSRIDTVVESKF